MKLLEMKGGRNVDQDLPEKNGRRKVHKYLEKGSSGYHWNKRSDNAILTGNLWPTFRHTHVGTDVPERQSTFCEVIEYEKCQLFHSYCVKFPRYSKIYSKTGKKYISSGEIA